MKSACLLCFTPIKFPFDMVTPSDIVYRHEAQSSSESMKAQDKNQLVNSQKFVSCLRLRHFLSGFRVFLGILSLAVTPKKYTIRPRPITLYKKPRAYLLNSPRAHPTTCFRNMRHAATHLWCIHYWFSHILCDVSPDICIVGTLLWSFKPIFYHKIIMHCSVLQHYHCSCPSLLINS